MSETTPTRTRSAESPSSGIEWVERNFQSLSERDGATSLVTRLRRPAFERFRETGFPTLRQEDWKYTNVAAPLTRRSFAPAAAVPEISLDDLRPHLPAGVTPDLVFVNGALERPLSRPNEHGDGVRVDSLASALEAGGADAECLDAHLGSCVSSETRPFVALNTAFLADGAFVRVQKNTVVERPIHIVFVNAGAPAEPEHGAAIHPRVFIFAERSSQATVVETHIGLDDAPRLSNPVSEVVVAENARVDHFKIQLEGSETYHVACIGVHQESSSTYRSQSFAFGARLARHDIDPVLHGDGAESTLNGLFVLDGEQHADTHSVIDHAKPHCTSNELYKGILAGKSRGVFSGRIVVRQDAQKTNAFQSNNNLLLSRHATIDTKPQLEIYADDVRCSHGATVGQIDDAGLFYLRSRGIAEANARQMLIKAFAVELFESIAEDATRELLEGFLERKLAAVAGESERA